MKIVLIGPAYPIRGGNALFVAHLYESLSATNDVQVISYSRLYPGFLFPGVRQTDISGVAIKKHPAMQIIDCLNPFTWWKAAHLAASMNPEMLVFTWWNPFFGFIVRTIASAFKRQQRNRLLSLPKMSYHTKADGSMYSLQRSHCRLPTDFLFYQKLLKKELRNYIQR